MGQSTKLDLALARMPCLDDALYFFSRELAIVPTMPALALGLHAKLVQHVVQFGAVAPERLHHILDVEPALHHD